jgi:hypothetical protein
MGASPSIWVLRQRRVGYIAPSTPKIKVAEEDEDELSEHGE